jgi:pyruvate/2-oxoglutarate dehydrogenase complex dihydrolipoamide acyltransferase (E2) component
MIVKVKTPKISANVEEETVTDWFKKEGDRVRKGEPLVEITTDKASVEVESPRSGVVRKILAAKKSTLPVGYVIALIGDPDDELPDVTAHNRRLLEKVRRAGRKGAGAGKGRGRGPRVRVRATPAARRLAREHGLDLVEVKAVADVDMVTETAVQAYLAEHGK